MGLGFGELSPQAWQAAKQWFPLGVDVRHKQEKGGLAQSARGGGGGSKRPNPKPQTHEQVEAGKLELVAVDFDIRQVTHYFRVEGDSGFRVKGLFFWNSGSRIWSSIVAARQWTVSIPGVSVPWSGQSQM